MANQTWSFDAPSGTYKNHAMSSDLRKASIAESKFMQFVKPENGYGKKKGESVTITRVRNLALPANGKLTEGVKIPEDILALSTIAITVVEWGRAVPFSSLAEDLSVFNLENVIQRALKDQMKLVMDGAACDAFQNAKVKYRPTGVASATITYDGVVSANAIGSNLNVYHIEQIRDEMYANLHVPAFEGDDYIGLVSTKAKRGIVSDPNWEEWHKYTDPASKYNSEIGKLENIRFIEINNLGALSGSLGSGVLGEAVIFGADAVAMALVQDPELRAMVPQDFGRSKAVAWYGILQFGLIWDTSGSAAATLDGEARIIHVL